jgi:hypothetical protein
MNEWMIGSSGKYFCFEKKKKKRLIFDFYLFKNGMLKFGNTFV